MAGVKRWFLFFALWFAADIAQHICFALTANDFLFGPFARGQIGGLFIGAYIWRRK